MAAAPLAKEPLSQQIDAKKRTGFGAGREQGESKLKFLTLKSLDGIDSPMFFNTLKIGLEIEAKINLLGSTTVLIPCRGKYERK